ncbi:hypothetical protein B0T25DRAFT_562945 [Lasiosphaeria hispida]|uniref:Uncharacterized protein n=1 Tax=Lasiosphaeria hispida TaxID=260671 RepID=A0AAJ0HW93_9PEZI|nr:hypothetical protein B0T25DRAFT_562945 [Lasiosphaeria hispida]
MLERAREALAAIFESHAWLSGAAPLWSWPITPSGSRLLLSDDYSSLTSCYLDRNGKSVALLALDGRYGDRYSLSSPETVRFCVSAHPPRAVSNLHPNMGGRDLRRQTLEVVYVSRKSREPRRRNMLLRVVPGFAWTDSWHFVTASIVGWVSLLAMIAMSIILQTYLSLAFLLLMPATGSVVCILYGITPRRLLINSASSFNRMVLVAENTNATNWTIFYGESTILNSLLNRLLEPQASQWALALGAAASKDWNAYFISFWVAFCICVHAYVIPSKREARGWLTYHAGLRIARYQTTLSSRRALLNTVLALNPDTFSLPHGAAHEDRTKLDEGALKWIDPILERGSSRTKWEQATLKAMNEAAEDDSSLKGTFSK